VVLDRALLTARKAVEEMKVTVDLLALILALHTPLLVSRILQESSVETRFSNIHLVTSNGKGDLTPVRIRFDSKSLLIEAKKDGSIVKGLDYSDVVGASYSYSKHPRWRTGIAGPVSIGVATIALMTFAAPLYLLKGRRHWLTFWTEKDLTVLRLDKGNFKSVVSEFETRIGKKVVIVE
jgi:hypothetical protein